MGFPTTPAAANVQPGPYQGYLDHDATTLAEALRTQGYRTYMSGKWHLGEHRRHWPREHGFDRYFGLISGASSYYEIIEGQPLKRQMAQDDEPRASRDLGRAHGGVHETLPATRQCSGSDILPTAVCLVHCAPLKLADGAQKTMKPGIHPKYNTIRATCSCGNVIETRSTLRKDIHLDVCSACHPFYTGKQKIADSRGRVERFRRHFGNRGSILR